MTKFVIQFVVLIFSSIVLIGSVNVLAEEVRTPDWIKNNAKWWSEDKINDSDFIEGIQYLLEQNIIQIQEKSVSTNQENKIPNWLKNTAGWWADDLIPESEFLKGLEFLVKNGIIQLPNNDSNMVPESWISENIKNCTRKSPEITYPDYDEYVSEKCLIEKAHTVNECHAYENSKILKTEILSSTGIKKISILFDVEACIQELAIKNNDPKTCHSSQDELTCIIKYVKETGKQEACLQASDSVLCVKSLVNIYGVESCSILSGEENKQCKIDYIKNHSKSSSGETYMRLMRQCESPGEGGPWHFACHLEIINPNLIPKVEVLQLKDENGQTILCANIGPSGGQDDTRNDDLCTATEAVYTLNKSQCDKSGTSRASCYQAFALHDPKFSVGDCSVLDDQEIGKCYVNVAARTQNISICIETSQYGVSEQECTSFVNYYNSWRNYGVYADVGPDTIFPKYK